MLIKNISFNIDQCPMCCNGHWYISWPVIVIIKCYYGLTSYSPGHLLLWPTALLPGWLPLQRCDSVMCQRRLWHENMLTKESETTLVNFSPHESDSSTVKPVYESVVPCDSHHHCPDGATCCKRLDLSWGCCPHPDVSENEKLLSHLLFHSADCSV